MSGTRPGGSGAPTSASGSGERYARTTARTATPGILPPRPRPLPCLPLGRGRARRVFRPKQRLCFAMALWNGKDPILKERLFGLTNAEGNHGEDVKEYYFYLDSTPTHSYMKWLYKYPQAAFPYDDLVEDERAPHAPELEYELARHRRLRRRPLLRRLRRVRQAVTGGYASSGSPSPTAVRKPRRFTAAHALVPQHLAAGGPAQRQAPPPAARGTSGASVVAASHPELGATALLRGRRRRCCSPRTRPTTSGSSTRPTPAPTSRTPSTTTWSTGTADAVNPAAAAPRRPPTTASSSAPASRPRSGSASPTRRAAKPTRSRPSRDPRRQAARGRRVLRAVHAGRRPARTPRSVMRQALAGMLWTQAVLLLRRQPVAARARRRIRSTRRRRPPSATATGSTWSTTTSSRCRTSGSTRGTPPGTSRSTPSR